MYVIHFMWFVSSTQTHKHPSAIKHVWSHALPHLAITAAAVTTPQNHFQKRARSHDHVSQPITALRNLLLNRSREADCWATAPSAGFWRFPPFFHCKKCPYANKLFHPILYFIELVTQMCKKDEEIALYFKCKWVYFNILLTHFFLTLVDWWALIQDIQDTFLKQMKLH